MSRAVSQSSAGWMVLALVLLAVAALVAAVPLWRGATRRRGRRLTAVRCCQHLLPVAVLLAGGIVGAVTRASRGASLTEAPAGPLAGASAGPLAPVVGGGLAGAVLLVLFALLAVVAGGPLTTFALELADRSGDTDDVAGREPVLRGGAWIGGLERAAVVASLLAGWPEGLAVVLGIKGLARYPELRAPAAAERFIIGTFTSVLWAASCAGVAALLTRP